MDRQADTDMAKIINVFLQQFMSNAPKVAAFRVENSLWLFVYKQKSYEI
jgi:hypothetical protein